MLKYVYIYNEITRIMGIVKLIYAGRLTVSKFKSKYVYGPSIYSSFVECDIRNKGFKGIRKLTDINDLPDYKKFIMDNGGYVYTTPTGYITSMYFYVSPGLKDDYKVEKRIILIKTDYLGKRLKFLFQIKKKFGLPRPVLYLIILALCEEYFKDCHEYICHRCDYIKSSRKKNVQNVIFVVVEKL